eukprot:scaffold35192_cov129-Isochrysis_galbana.AAC.5
MEAGKGGTRRLRTCRACVDRPESDARAGWLAVTRAGCTPLPVLCILSATIVGARLEAAALHGRPIAVVAVLRGHVWVVVVAAPLRMPIQRHERCITVR